MKPRFAICINNLEYPASLELYKIYQVLPDEDAERDGDLRVVDERGEDYLYPAAYFVLIEVPKETEPIPSVMPVAWPVLPLSRRPIPS